LGKFRPVVVVGIPFLDHERTLFIIVPHATSLLGTRFEVAVNHAMLGAGAFFRDRPRSFALVKQCPA